MLWVLVKKYPAVRKILSVDPVTRSPTQIFQGTRNDQCAAMEANQGATRDEMVSPSMGRKYFHAKKNELTRTN